MCSHTTRTSWNTPTSFCKSSILLTPGAFSDNQEQKQGVEGVCNFINTKFSDFVKGKELPLSKAQLLQISGWVQR